MSLVQSKQQLRETYLAKRESLPHTQQMHAAHKAAAFFLAHALFHQLTRDTIIAAYHATEGEMDPAPLLEEMVRHGLTVALPVITGRAKPLAFAPWHPAIKMRKGDFIEHILEPAHAPEERCEPSLVIVPLLAVDENGHRLGFGGGYYDRTLETLQQKNPALITVGMGYSWQKSATPLPSEPHDIALDYFLSDEGIEAF